MNKNESSKLPSDGYLDAKLEKLTISENEPIAKIEHKRTFRAIQYADDIRDGFKVLRESAAL